MDLGRIFSNLTVGLLENSRRMSEIRRKLLTQIRFFSRQKELFLAFFEPFWQKSDERGPFLIKIRKKKKSQLAKGKEGRE